MANYIDREKAREIVCDFCRWAGTSNCEECEHPVDDIPAADVRPVKHGEWIVDDHGDYQLIECDQCHAQMWNHQSELPNYCYECGADMRKVVEIDQVKEGEQ